MQTRTYGDHLTQITRFPGIFPISCYLVREHGGFTLVDTGMSGSAQAIMAIAAAQGAPIMRIALTHAHVDHAGSLDALHAALPAAEVSIGVREARLLAGERSLDPDEPQDKLRGGFLACATRPTRLLQPGERVGSLEVVAAPGHTPGQVAFLDTRDGTLIAGDAFQTQGRLVVAGQLHWRFPVSPFATWHRPTALASAAALRALNPTRLAVGHGPVIEQPAAALDAAIEAARRKIARERAHA